MNGTADQASFMLGRRRLSTLSGSLLSISSKSSLHVQCGSAAGAKAVEIEKEREKKRGFSCV